MKLFVTLFLICSTTLASNLYKVERLIGEASFNNSPVKVGMIFKEAGLLKTKSRSFVKISSTEFKNTIALGAKSQLRIDPSKNLSTSEITLIHGGLRWISEQGSSKGAKVKSKTAALGVRGTDFFMKNNILLAETEIVLFEGKVNFQSVANPKDQVLIIPGQWGGLGGRFGNKVKVLGNLPQNIVDHFNKMLKL